MIKVGDKFKCQRIIQIQESMSRNRENLFVENVALFSFELPNYFCLFSYVYYFIILSFVYFITSTTYPNSSPGGFCHEDSSLYEGGEYEMSNHAPNAAKSDQNPPSFVIFKYFYFNSFSFIFNFTYSIYKQTITSS